VGKEGGGAPLHEKNDREETGLGVFFLRKRVRGKPKSKQAGVGLGLSPKKKIEENQFATKNVGTKPKDKRGFCGGGGGN